MKLFAILRTTAFRSVVMSVVAFQLVNVSIDPVDHHVGAQDVAINEIESCVELIVEGLLGKVNAIEETDEADQSAHRPVTTYILLFNFVPGSIDIETPVRLDKNIINAFSESLFHSLSRPVNSPPPRQLV